MRFSHRLSLSMDFQQCDSWPFVTVRESWWLMNRDPVTSWFVNNDKKWRAVLRPEGPRKCDIPPAAVLSAGSSPLKCLCASFYSGERTWILLDWFQLLTTTTKWLLAANSRVSNRNCLDQDQPLTSMVSAKNYFDFVRNQYIRYTYDVEVLSCS